MSGLPDIEIPDEIPAWQRDVISIDLLWDRYDHLRAVAVSAETLITQLQGEVERLKDDVASGLPERPEEVQELFRLYDGPCDWDELAQAADCGDLLDLAKAAKVHIVALESLITQLQGEIATLTKRLKRARADALEEAAAKCEEGAQKCLKTRDRRGLQHSEWTYWNDRACIEDLCAKEIRSLNTRRES